MRKYILPAALVLITTNVFSQILGGGTTFANAQVFNQSWLTNCPSAGTALSNQAAFEPTTTMDGCAPAPACNSGTAGSDVWFYFFATSTTATIIINPSASFDAALQAFSGSACPGLTDIGCVDAGGNNQPETLSLTGLTIGTRYYFRVFGATNSAPNRTGTYTFCGSAALGSGSLPVTLTKFTGENRNNSIFLNWSVAAEVDHELYKLEYSNDGVNFSGKAEFVPKGNSNTGANYTYTDNKIVNGKNYYRLRMISNNGTSTYSHTISITVRGLKSLVVFPNPAKDRLFIDAKETATAVITNNNGIRMLMLQLKTGRNEVDIRQLAAGTYFLKTGTGNETQVFTVTR